MTALKLIQSVLGLLFAFYIFKGLLGKFQDGDFKRASLVAITLLTLSMITSGTIRFS